MKQIQITKKFNILHYIPYIAKTNWFIRKPSVISCMHSVFILVNIPKKVAKWKFMLTNYMIMKIVVFTNRELICMFPVKLSMSRAHGDRRIMQALQLCKSLQ